MKHPRALVHREQKELFTFQRETHPDWFPESLAGIGTRKMRLLFHVDCSRQCNFVGEIIEWCGVLVFLLIVLFLDFSSIRLDLYV